MSSVQGESPLVQVKEPSVISIWLLVGFHPATRSVQSTPADNTRKRVWQYIEKDTIVFDLGPETKVSDQYKTFCDAKMYPHTKFGIPTSNRIEVMLQT